MGTSNPQNISYCLDQIIRLDPKSVLDLGCGYGRWGILCREFLDVWQGRINKNQWKRTIIGVEGHGENITEGNLYYYTSILHADIKDFLSRKPQKNYELVILGDVLEHFTDEDAEIVFLSALTKASRGLMLVVPIGDDWPQGPLGGNEYERHRSQWTVDKILSIIPDEVRDSLRWNYKYFKDYIDRDLVAMFFYTKEA